MAFRLVVLDKRSVVRPVGIGETLQLVIRISEDQAKAVCRNPQMCAGLDANIEEATHDVGQR